MGGPMEEERGKVIIAPEVLVTIARLTTLSVPGVTRMAGHRMRNVNCFFGRTTSGGGVKLEVTDDGVAVDLYIIAEPEANMLNLGRAIQREVTRAIQDTVGMEVHEVNVHIQDVEFPFSEE